MSATVKLLSMVVKKKAPLVSVHLNFMCTEAEAKWLRARAKREKSSVSATVRGFVAVSLAEERETRSAARKARREVSTPTE